MSKRLILILSVFIGAAMIALIVVQIYWINSAIDVKEKQFVQQINRLLSKIAYDIERQEAMSHIYNEFQPKDTLLPGTNNYFDTVFGGGNNSLRYQQNVTIYKNSRSNANISGFTILGNDTFVFSNNNQEKIYGEIKGSNKNIESQYYRQQLNERRKLVDNIVDRMFSFEKDISERVNPEKLESVIEKVFSDRNLKLDYEFAVTRNYNQIAFKSEGFYINNDLEYYKIRLFPEDFISSNNFLYLYFPKKKTFIFKTLGFMATSSMILTLIVVISFAVTLLVIYRQKKLSEIKNDFISNMTHELKTPISTISLATQMLQDKSIPVEAKNIDHISGIIADESKRLGYQVEKVLQMATFDKGKIKLKMKDVHLHEIIESAVHNFSIQVKNREGDILPELNADEDFIYGDVVQLTNVISNLLDNAIKYCKGIPEISIITKNIGKSIVMTVKDNGIGISKDNQKRIFEKFYRVPTGNLHNVKGFGLGLSYVKMIVDAHQGDISIKSELNKGTSIIIQLPLKDKQND